MVLVLVLGACGGDDDGGSLDCSEYTACGGDPVGEWTFVDSCFDGDPGSPIEECPEATSEISNVVVTGTASIQDNGSYSITTEFNGDVVLVVPLDCLGGATCADLSEAAEVTCTEDGDACNCMDELSESSQETGTWEVDGNTFTTTAAGEAPQDASFCVEGDVVKLQPEADPGDPQVTYVLERD